MRVLLRDVLAALGVSHIREADDGSHAFEIMADADSPFVADLVLCDQLMEPMDGLTFVRRLRQSPASPNPYAAVIMVTAYTDIELVAKARDAGVNDFLAKPISARTLYSHIADCVTASRQFVRTPDYFGPDRRRRDLVYDVAKRRDDVDYAVAQQA